MRVFHSLADPQLAVMLKQGAVGVLPTDTVYGLVCAAGNEQSVARLYALKDRERKPGTIIAASIQQLTVLGIKRRYLKAVEQYWPGPVSVVLPHMIEYLHQGLGSQPVRIPAGVSLQTLLEQTGALQTTSANPPGEQPARNISEAEAYFRDKVDFYVDAGDLIERPPSTIIRVVDDAIEVIRQGVVKLDESGRVVKN